MSSSPIHKTYQHNDFYLTPSRKPTQHHCNADKKIRPPIRLHIEPSLCRNLFGELQTINDLQEKQNMKLSNTKNFR